jgi:2-amino-4-hydroxy-6-hydroxymethyldihydropteridine diphosphokinase
MPGNDSACSESILKTHIAFISVGSNIGRRLENCRKAIQSLTAADVWLKAQSRIYETEPVDYRNQNWFINYAIKVETILDPFQLLTRIESIQYDAGRIRDAIRFGPRIIDLDIIFYDEVVINSPRLVIPHPRMHTRRFVLRPLCDIEAELIHPVLKLNMQTLLDGLDEHVQRIIEHR